MLSLLTVVAGAAVHVYAAQFNIYHRVVQSTSSPVPFAQRGTLNLVGSNANLESVSTLSEDLARFTQHLKSEDVSGALYQVALQRPDDSSETEWAVSSVKLVGSDLIIHTASPSLNQEWTVSPLFLDHTNFPFLSFG